MKRVMTLACVLLAWAVSATWAQQVDGSLQGRVLDADGQPLGDVRITVTGPHLLGTLSTTSDKDGGFLLQAVPVGTFELHFSHVAHNELRMEQVVVGLGRTTSLGDIRLERRAIEMQAVVVSAQKSPVDMKSATTQNNLPSKVFQALPNDRDFRSMVNLVPGANVADAPAGRGTSSSISGGTGEETYYFIDGMDSTDPRTAGTSTALPYNLVQEVDVKTGGYEAEYGHASGGIVNVITPSGGNEFHGEVFGFFTARRLEGKTTASALAPSPGDFKASDLGLSLGGPIARDKLWFYAAYNPTFDSRHAEVVGIPAQEFTTTVQRFATKLTWRADPATNVTLTGLGDLSKGRAFFFGPNGVPAQVLNEDAAIADNETGGVNVSLRATHQVRSNVLLTGSVSRVHARQNEIPISDRYQTEPEFFDSPTLTQSGGLGEIQKNVSDRTEAQASASLFTGKHHAKFGVEYLDNSITNDFRAGLGKGGQGFLSKDSDTLFTWFQQFQIGTVHAKSPALYLQDSWAVHERLRINAGFRWDALFIKSSDGTTPLKITDEYQPRVGLIFEPGTLGSHKVFASFGRFYGQVPAWSPGYYFFGSEQRTVHYRQDPRIDPTPVDSIVLLPNPPGIGKLKGPNFDEVTLGYERDVQHTLKLGIRTIYRTQRETIEDASNSAGDFLLGNPGKGSLDFLPAVDRTYMALELSVEKLVGDRGSFIASYVMSRKHGNYDGLDFGNAGPQFDAPDGHENITGLLSSDRTHVLKVAGSYRVLSGLTAGGSWLLESGTPLSDLGATSLSYVPAYLTPRGSLGRTPRLWNLDVRLAYDRLGWPGSTHRPKLTLDMFHLFSQHRAVLLDQQHYFAVDAQGQQTQVNPRFLQPLLYQPPFSVRLGLVVDY